MEVPLLFVELVAAIENMKTLEEEICLCTRLGDKVFLNIRTVEPITPVEEQH